MRIEFLTDGKLCEREPREDGELTIADIYAFSFGSIGEVDYEKEIAGVTNEMEDVALFSHHFSCVAVAGCYTNTKGIRRRSAIVADRGKILGVSDMTVGWDEENFKCGSGLRIYETGVGRVGVLISKDIYVADHIKSLSECGAEMVICVYEHLSENNVEQLLIRTDSFRYGVPICLCAHGFSEVSDAYGRLHFASPKRISQCKIEPTGEYHLLHTRRKGFGYSKNMF